MIEILPISTSIGVKIDFDAKLILKISFFMDLSNVGILILTYSLPIPIGTIILI